MKKLEPGRTELGKGKFLLLQLHIALSNLVFAPCKRANVGAMSVEYLGALQNCPSICIYFPCVVEPHTIVHSGADIASTNKTACKTGLVVAHTAMHVLRDERKCFCPHWSADTHLQQAAEDMGSKASCLKEGSEQLEWERQRNRTPVHKATTKD